MGISPIKPSPAGRGIVSPDPDFPPQASSDSDFDETLAMPPCSPQLTRADLRQVSRHLLPMFSGNFGCGPLRFPV